MKHPKISCQKHKIDSLLLSSRCMTNYMKSRSFLHARFSDLMKVVDNLFKKAYGEKLVYWKDIYCRFTLELPHRGNSNVYLQYMLLKIRKRFGNLHFPSIMTIVFTSFKHSKLPISIKIPVTLLQIVYICMTALSQNSSLWTTSLLTC